MSLVFWDTNLFIYYLEDRTPRADRVQTIRERMLERNDRLVTSHLTLGEVLVKPTRDQRRISRRLTSGCSPITPRSCRSIAVRP